eukprot:1233199-Pleurochrysis_carterae.AAC.1
MRAAIALLSEARLLSWLLTLGLVSVYAYLAAGERILGLQAESPSASLPTRFCVNALKKYEACYKPYYTSDPCILTRNGSS